jgi:hypothetical protein
MLWFGLRSDPVDEAIERERVRERMLEQERRIRALDRAVEVVQRQLSEDRPHAHQ